MGLMRRWDCSAKSLCVRIFVPGAVRQNGIGGGEAVLEGVEADPGLALWGFGPGAAPGVAPVGVDLLLRWHKRHRQARGCWCVSRAPPVL